MNYEGICDEWKIIKRMKVMSQTEWETYEFQERAQQKRKAMNWTTKSCHINVEPSCDIKVHVTWNCSPWHVFACSCDLAYDHAHGLYIARKRGQNTFPPNAILKNSPFTKTLHYLSMERSPNQDITYVDQEHKFAGHERPSTNSPIPILHPTTPLFANLLNPLDNYDLNMCIAMMQFPILRVIEQPITPNGTPSLITCGKYITFNNCFHRHFMVIKISHLIIHLNHITYIIHDLTAKRNIYLLVPWRWTTENNCWKRRSWCWI